MFACLLVALANRVIDPLMITRFGAPEATQAKAFWAAPGRYQVEDQRPDGPYAPASTAEGSAWLLRYYQALYPGQPVLPDREPQPATAEQRDAQAWLDRRMQTDWAVADLASKALNEHRDPLPDGRDDTPARLRAALGPAPRFAAPCRAHRYTVAFPDLTFLLADAPTVRRTFPYLRAVEGVDIQGTATGDAAWAPALRQAGASGQTGRVLQAVSRLEGGFDSVNTYDTGRVSVGVVQFAAMADGRGSLGQVLLAWRNGDKAGFVAHLHRYGIDVTPDGELAVLDPATGWELHGPAAVWKVRQDKRLAAVLARAGRVSSGFQAAQVRSALAQFWPADKRASWSVGGRGYSVRLGDVFRSDAGLATLLDRAVNTGDVGPALAMVQSEAARLGARGPADLAAREADFISALRYRQDFMAVAGLSRPQAYLASSRAAPPPLPGTALAPADPLTWQPQGSPAKAADPPKKVETVPALPEGADPKVAIPLGPPPEQRKPEDFESPLKRKPPERQKPGGG